MSQPGSVRPFAAASIVSRVDAGGACLTAGAIALLCNQLRARLAVWVGTENVSSYNEFAD
jgi:hypothetical protein